MSEVRGYIVHRDDQPGRVEFSRDTENAPERITVALQLLQDSHPSVLRVRGAEILILNDRYRVVGWNEDRHGLDCELAE